MENTLVGTKVLETVTYQIEILELSKEVPNEFIPDFINWLQSQAIKSGPGKDCSQYAYTDDYDDDIATTFYVKTVT